MIISGLSQGRSRSHQTSDIHPKTWDDQAMMSLQLPPADRRVSPKLISSDYYYRMPVRPVYKSCPVYRPDREPRGYFDELKRKEPPDHL